MANRLNAGLENGNWSDKDIVIALVGPAASGKSSFVEKAAGIEGLSRGGLGSSTEELSVFKIPFPGFIDTTICFVDTPGIDGGERGLYDVFDMICVWFNKTYHKEIGLAGLLYFHPISNLQKFRLPLMRSNYFKRLCQNELNRVTLTSTMWDGVDERTGTLHEAKLKRFYKPLIEEGLSVKRFLNDPSSAFDILRPIVQAASSRQSTIGRALVVGRSLATTAIKSLQRDSPPIIVIIGRYRCGKSQFIDCLTQTTSWAHDGLRPQDHPVRSVTVQTRVQNGYGTIVLVDTPGFDGYTRTAEDILEDVYDWLIQNHNGSKVAGLLFLQNIHSRWIKPPPIPVLKMIGGDDVTKKLIFVTTHWDQIELNLGIARERLICRRLEPLLRSDPCMSCFDMKTKTAWRILKPLLQPKN